jgi:hypothetical protein
VSAGFSETRTVRVQATVGINAPQIAIELKILFVLRWISLNFHCVNQPPRFLNSQDV